MPTDSSVVEYASLFGALETGATESGDFAHAHVLREIARNGHRLAGRGNYLVTQVWTENSPDAVDTGTRAMYVGPRWQRVMVPMVIKRKTHLRTGSVQFYARITDGMRVLLQVVTGGRSPRFDMRHVNADATCVDCLGTGGWEWYEATVMPLGPHEVDRVDVWAYGDILDTAFDTGVFGTPATGTPSSVLSIGFEDSGASWDNVEFSERPNAVSVTFYSSSGAVIIPPRPVVSTITTNSDYLSFARGYELSEHEVRLGNSPGVTYELTGAALMRMGTFILREEDAYAL